MGWIIFIFLIIFVVILFGAHWLVYFSVVKFFNIESHNLRLSLGVIILILSLSFILASLLAHWKENELTRIFYWLANGWLALLNNLVLALIGAWIIKWGLKFANLNYDFQKIAIFIIFIALGGTVWGIWNAFHPQIKNITVKIKNLPANWQGKKAVQLSDIHLGFIYRPEFLKKIVMATNSAKPDVVFITGDLFDGMDGELNSLTASLNDLETKNIFMVTGNHETYLGVDKAKKALELNPNIKILENEQVDLAGLKIIGLSYPGREGMGFKFSEVIKNLPNYNPTEANILLYHEPKNILEAKELGIKLQLAGHTHRGQSFPFNFITHWVYKGYDYGFFTSGDYNLYATTGAGTWGPPMRTGNRPEIVVIKFE